MVGLVSLERKASKDLGIIYSNYINVNTIY